MKNSTLFEIFEDSFKKSVLTHQSCSNIEGLIKTAVHSLDNKKINKKKRLVIAFTTLFLLIFPTVIFAYSYGMLQIFDSSGNPVITVKKQSSTIKPTTLEGNVNINKIEEQLKDNLLPGEVVHYIEISKYSQIRSIHSLKSPITYDSFNEFKKLYWDKCKLPETLAGTYKFNKSTVSYEAYYQMSDFDNLYESVKDSNQEFAYKKYNLKNTHPQNFEVQYINESGNMFNIIICQAMSTTIEFSHFENYNLSKMNIDDVEILFSHEANTALWRQNNLTYRMSDFHMTDALLKDVITQFIKTK